MAGKKQGSPLIIPITPEIMNYSSGQIEEVLRQNSNTRVVFARQRVVGGIAASIFHPDGGWVVDTYRDQEGKTQRVAVPRLNREGLRMMTEQHPLREASLRSFGLSEDEAQQVALINKRREQREAREKGKTGK